MRVEMLRKGLVDAICVVPPGPIRLTREGFNILGGPKDLKIGSPISAVAVTDARIKSNRDETKRVLRAVCAGCVSCTNIRKSHPDYGQMVEPDARGGAGFLDSILPSFSVDGGTVDKTYEFAIDARKATVRSDKVVPLSQVRDVSLLREVQKELRLQ